MQLISVNIPFAGFCDSVFSDLVDHETKIWPEYQDRSEYPEELWIDESDLAELLWPCVDYSAAYQAIARDYAEAYDAWLAEKFGINFAAKRKFWSYADKKHVTKAYRQDTCKMTFEEMTSPREYNFETDRLFVTMPLYILARIRKAVGEVKLAAAFKERFTSYSGFISHYDPTIPDKPLAEWDHNEAGTILHCFEFDDWEIYESLVESSYDYFEAAVDWPAVESAMREKRSELLTEWLESEPDRAKAYLANGGDSFGLECDGMAISYRCTKTMEMAL